MKVGIAFAGGGVRGAAHLGVIQALEESGIEISIYSGTSAGSIIATMKAAGATNEECMEILAEVDKGLMDIAYLDILLSIPGRFQSLDAVFKGDRLKHILNKYMYKIEEDKMPFALGIVSTDVYSGTQVIFSTEDIKPEDVERFDNKARVLKVEEWPQLSEVVYSSCALPGVFRPLKHMDMGLVDGSVTNNLPANVASAMGADKVIAVHLSEQYPEIKETKGIYNIIGKSINILVGQNSFLSISHSKDILELYPDVSNIGLLEFEKAVVAYETGYRYAVAHMDEIKMHLSLDK